MPSRELTSPRSRQVAALPWKLKKDGSLSILLVTSRANGKWMLPKGWPMQGEADAEAAQREALEEAGIEGIVSSGPLGSYFYIRVENDGSTTPAQAIIFSLPVSKTRSKWDEKGERRRKWFTADKAADVVHERDLARFLRSVAVGRMRLF